MKYILQYFPGDMSKATANFPAHQAGWKQFRDQGTLLMIGPLTPPAEFAALAVFTTREAAEAFAKADPFVLNGVVSRWSILEWKEALVAP